MASPNIPPAPRQEDFENPLDTISIVKEAKDVKSTALQWLQKARNAGCSSTTISDAPALDNLHGNEQFIAIPEGQSRHEK